MNWNFVPSTGDSDPPLLPTTVVDLESRPGVDDDPTPKIGFTRGFVGDSGSSPSPSLCDARNLLPNGEFLSPDIPLWLVLVDQSSDLWSIVD